MTWNYRIVEVTNGDEKYYDIREVYYEEGEEVANISSTSQAAQGETKEDLVRQLELMLKDAKERPVLVPPKDWIL